VRSRPRVNSQRLRISHIGKVRDQLEVVDNLRPSLLAALDTEAQNASEASGEVLLRELVALVRGKTRVRNPRDVLVLLQPLGQLERILGMALAAQREGLHAEQQLLGGEGVESGA
jgi:hypothetical protein